MKLLTKGLLVTLVPFLCQIAFVSWLIVQLWQVQNQVTLTAQSSEIASEAHLVFLQYAEQLQYILSKNWTQYGPLVYDPGGHLAKLESLCRGDLERRELLDILKEEARNLSDISMSVDRKQHDLVLHRGHSDVYLPELVWPASTKVFFATTNLVNYEQSRFPFSNTPSVKKIDELVSSICTLAVASFVLALLLGCFYSFGIRKPLLHLQENAILLAQRLPLLPATSADDEIGQVDKLLHEVSEALYDALSRERELLDNAVAMICALSENGSLTSVNPYGERLLGMPRDKILKTSVYDHIWPEDVVRADSEFNSIRYVSAAKSVELRIKSGSGLPIETRWSLQGTAGQTDIFCIVYDISEEKNIEALKQNFIDMVSDELRNPLKTMLSTVNSLLQGEVGQLSDESRPDVELAQRSVVRLIAFVNDFIDFQRLSAGDSALQFEPHLLHELVSEATAVVSAFAQERGVSLTTKLMDATIVCDRPKVVQMLVNLLTNAIKFSPAGGEVEIFYTSRGGVYSLGVSDTGPGIAPEYRERIFDAFEQVPGTNNKEGTGLGLAICKLMAQAHGWKISVEGRNESEFYRDAPASSGAVFCISIPSPLRFGQV